MSEMAWNYVSDMFSHLLLNNSISLEDKRYVSSYLPEIAHALSKLPFKSGEGSLPDEISKIIAFMNKARETAITADELVRFTSTEGISLSILSIGIGIGLMEHDRNSKHAVFFLTQFGRLNGISELADVLSRENPWVALPRGLEGAQYVSNSLTVEGKDFVSGRVSGVRRHKRTTFIDITSQPENQQLAFDNQSLPQAEDIALGDYLSVEGTFGFTKSLTKALFVGGISVHIKPSGTPTDKMAQAWQQAQEEGRVLFLLRQGLTDMGFLEVQTDTLSIGYEGGSSRPFISFENSSGVTKYLRVTSELELLKLIAGGAQKIFELGRSYRNERNTGEGSKEFTMLEAYSAMHSLDEFSEQFCSSVLSSAFGRAIAFKKKRFAEIAKETIGMSDVSDSNLRAYAAAEMPEIDAQRYGTEELAEAVYNRKIVPLIQEPTILTELPMKGSPLIKGEGVSARRHWVVIHGMELAEIAENEVDYDCLRSKFERQFLAEESFVYRNYVDFLNAIAQGMPRTVGVGLGCKRLLEVIRMDRKSRDQIADPIGPQ